MWEIISIIFGFYLALFIVSIAIQDNSIADVFWGLGFVIISVYLYFSEGFFSFGHNLTMLIIAAWGVRLFSLFVQRKLHHAGEDKRYAKWRDEWKYFYTRSFFQVYMLQMLLMFIIAIPLFLIFMNDSLNSLFLTVGITIALTGLIFEIIADRQVQQFLAQKKKGENVVYTEGLYKYSRHPNYFGESTFWLGISIVSLPISIFGILSYIVITFLLLKVSGVPMKEASHRKKDNWEEYAKKTNKFFPWFPKEKASTS